MFLDYQYVHSSTFDMNKTLNYTEKVQLYQLESYFLKITIMSNLNKRPMGLIALTWIQWLKTSESLGGPGVKFLSGMISEWQWHTVWSELDQKCGRSSPSLSWYHYKCILNFDPKTRNPNIIHIRQPTLYIYIYIYIHATKALDPPMKTDNIYTIVVVLTNTWFLLPLDIMISVWNLTNSIATILLLLYLKQTTFMSFPSK